MGYTIILVQILQKSAKVFLAKLASWSWWIYRGTSIHLYGCDCKFCKRRQTYKVNCIILLLLSVSVPPKCQSFE